MRKVIKNIVIQDQVYKLPLENSKAGSQGICYKLVTEKENFAVKFYYQDRLPSLDKVNYFAKLSRRTSPILLTEYPVYDLDSQYIGCACPYIDETIGKTKDLLYDLPRKSILKYLEEIEQKIKIFNRNHIQLGDFGIHNMKIGRGKNLPFGMYLFDDGLYTTSSEKKTEIIKNNRDEFASLIYDIMQTYVLNYMDCSEQRELLYKANEEYKTTRDSLSLLERRTRGFPSLRKYFHDYEESFRKKWLGIKK